MFILPLHVLVCDPCMLLDNTPAHTCTHTHTHTHTPALLHTLFPCLHPLFPGTLLPDILTAGHLPSLAPTPCPHHLTPSPPHSLTSSHVQPHSLTPADASQCFCEDYRKLEQKYDEALATKVKLESSNLEVSYSNNFCFYCIRTIHCLWCSYNFVQPTALHTPTHFSSHP